MTKVKLIRLLDINNDCNVQPVSINLNQTINWETPDGDPATVTEKCCTRFGYFWNSTKEACFFRPNIGTRSLITAEAPTLAPTRFGAPVSFNAAMTQPVRTITNDYVITNYDRMIFGDTTSGNVKIYLPSAATITGREFVIQKTVAGNILSIIAYTGETINGASSMNLTGATSTITIISNGTDFKSTTSK
jgi:hypothetical protein